MIKHGITTKKPMVISRSVAKSCFDMQGLCGSKASIDTEDISMQIRKAGGCTPLIEYPVFEIEDNKLCFYWDDLLYELEEGRYLGDLFFGQNKVAEVQFIQDSGISISDVTHIERQREVDCDD